MGPLISNGDEKLISTMQLNVTELRERATHLGIMHCTPKCNVEGVLTSYSHSIHIDPALTFTCARSKTVRQRTRKKNTVLD